MGFPMHLELKTGPTVEPVSLAEAKLHARVDATDEDTLIAQMIAAAVAKIDGADGELGRALITQSWFLRLDGFPRGGNRGIKVPLPPLQSVTVISYVDTNGADQVLDSSAYQVVGKNQAQPGSIVEAHGRSWPSTRCQPEAVRVEFVAGYGGTADAVPADIRLALLQIVAHWYVHRESVVGRAMAELPDSAAAIIDRRRVWSFG